MNNENGLPLLEKVKNNPELEKEIIDAFVTRYKEIISVRGEDSGLTYKDIEDLCELFGVTKVSNSGFEYYLTNEIKEIVYADRTKELCGVEVKFSHR